MLCPKINSVGQEPTCNHDYTAHSSYGKSAPNLLARVVSVFGCGGTRLRDEQKLLLANNPLGCTICRSEVPRNRGSINSRTGQGLRSFKLECGSIGAFSILTFDTPNLVRHRSAYTWVRQSLKKWTASSVC